MSIITFFCRWTSGPALMALGCGPVILNLLYHPKAVGALSQKIRLPKADNFNGLRFAEDNITLHLINSKVDVSPVIKVAQALKQTDYEVDLIQMDNFIKDTVRYDIPDLCSKAVSKKICIATAHKQISQAFDNILKEKEQDILYPVRYEPLGTSDQHAIDNLKLEAEDDSQCKYNYNSSTALDLLQSSPAVYHQMMESSIKKKPTHTQESILEDMAFELSVTEYPKACLKASNLNHRICKSMKKNLAIKKQRFYEMVDLVYGSSLDKTTIATALCFDCHKTTNVNVYEEFDDLFDNLVKQAQCVDPKPGEQKQVQSGANFWSPSWTVHREEDGSYTVPLNIHFVADDKDYGGSVPRAAVPQYYKDKVQQCLKKANTKMLGPNGEKLQIVLKHKSENPCEKSRSIKIGPQRTRSHKKKYAADVGCATIVHEVLHLLGLCDEYKETVKGFYLDPDTKEVIGTRDVRGTSKPFDNNNLEGADFEHAYKCRVTSDDPFGNIMATSHLTYAVIVEKDPTLISAFDISPEGKSLLTKGQFNAILYGSCDKKNRLFNECSRLAYQDTINSEFERDDSCLDLKKKCIEMNGMGTKDKAEEISRLQNDVARLKSEKKRIQNALKHLQNTPFDGSVTKPHLGLQNNGQNALSPALTDDFEMVSPGSATGGGSAATHKGPSQNTLPPLVPNLAPIQPPTPEEQQRRLKAKLLSVSADLRSQMSKLQKVKLWTD